MINAISTAISGMQTATKQVERSASNIANLGTQGAEANLPRDIVDIKIAETAFKANIAVIETVNEMTDTLLKAFDEKV